MVMSITFEDLEFNRVWTYSNVTDIHFNEQYVCVKGYDGEKKYCIREFNCKYDQCYITFD